MDGYILVSNLYSNEDAVMDLNTRRRFMGFVEKQSEARLPSEYQEVKYIEIVNNEFVGYKNKISLQHTNFELSVAFQYVDKIEFSASLDAQRSNTMLFSAWTENANGAGPFITANSAGILTDSGSDMDFTTSDLVKFDGKPFVITLDNVVASGSTRYITFGAWNDATYSATMNWYYVKLYKNGECIVDLVPCYRKEDIAIGFYDIVRNIFVEPHPASNPDAFIVGDRV